MFVIVVVVMLLLLVGIIVVVLLKTKSNKGVKVLNIHPETGFHIHP